MLSKTQERITKISGSMLLRLFTKDATKCRVLNFKKTSSNAGLFVGVVSIILTFTTK